jgi:RNA polymerase sigma factor (sigma-70 family)
MAAGEQSALAQFYETTCAQVHGLVLHILKDSALAEEVTLDIYLEVWRKASHYSEQRGAPISWLMTVARSRAIDKLRVVRKERWQSEASVDEAVAIKKRRPPWLWRCLHTSRPRHCTSVSLSASPAAISKRRRTSP